MIIILTSYIQKQYLVSKQNITDLFSNTFEPTFTDSLSEGRSDKGIINLFKSVLLEFR